MLRIAPDRGISPGPGISSGPGVLAGPGISPGPGVLASPWIPANPWLPVSACDADCVARQRRCRVGRVRVLLRVAALISVASVVTVTGIATLAAPRRVRHRHWRFAARGALAALGLRVDIVDHRPAGARRARGELVVVNHVSFLDVIAVAAVAPGRFVAKREVLEMGPAGPVLGLFGILPHRRGDLRELPPLVDRVSGLLGRGRPVVVFPEGTTWCGTASGSFRPAFFQSAIDAGAPVLPMALTYTQGEQTATCVGFIGDDSVGDTLRRILSARGLRLTLTVHPHRPPDADRRTLAATCERTVFGIPQPAARIGAEEPVALAC